MITVLRFYCYFYTTNRSINVSYVNAQSIRIILFSGNWITEYLEYTINDFTIEYSRINVFFSKGRIGNEVIQNVRKILIKYIFKCDATITSRDAFV